MHALENQFSVTREASRSSLLVLLVLFGSQAILPAQEVRWVTQARGNANEVGYSTAADAAGNVYVAGRFEQTATFGATNLTCAGRGDLFLAKYDSAGHLRWVLQGGATNDAQATSVAVASDGSVFVCGTFSSPIRFGTNVLESGGDNANLFIARLDAEAGGLWARQTTVGGRDVASWQPTYSPQLALDSRNQVCVSGFTGMGSGTIAFGTNMLGSEGCFGFLAEYDTDGRVLWARQNTVTLESPFGCFIENHGVATDAEDNIYVTGQYWGGTAWFGTNQLSTNFTGFIAKYDPTGALLWVRGIGELLEYGPPPGTYRGTAQGYELAVDVQGNIYLAGTFSGLVGFGTNILFAVDLETFVAKCDPAGNVLWVQRGLGSCSSEPEDIFLSHDEVWMTGWTADYAIWGTNFVGFDQSSGHDLPERTFLVRFDAGTGSIKQVLGTDVSVCGMAPDPAGDVLLSGSVVDAWLGTNHLTNSTGDTLGREFDFFLAKLQAFPFIAHHPESLTDYWGRSVCFTVAAESPRPLSYQWQKDGADLIGATNSTLNLTDLLFADAGAYRVVVRDSAGEATSAVARLEVRPAAVALEVTAGVAGLTIGGVAGRTYQVQCVDELQATNTWRTLTNLTLISPAQTWFDPESPSHRSRFYRIVIP